MVRKTGFIIALLLVVGISSAKEVIATAGSQFSDNDIQISWTLGEAVIETVASESVQLTQGFHQPNLTVTAIEEVPDLSMEITAYPNPTSNYVNIKITNATENKLNYLLFDNSGRLLQESEITSDITEITMLNYAAPLIF